MRELKPATIIRNLKRENNGYRTANIKLVNERDWYRNRATKAEQEVKDWKARFDVLLRRDQSEPPKGEGA